ncbi:MAG: TlpA disulfide reductase family protein [Gemmatimonadota bacterium]
MRRLATLAFLAGAAALLAAVLWRSDEPEAHALHGHAAFAASYAAPDLAGDTVALADLRGEVVVVNLWATWCRPCVREMPSLQRLQDDLGDRGLRVLAVSVDRLPKARAAEEVGRFMEEIGVELEVLLDPEGRAERVFGSLGLPTTIVLDRDGALVYRRLGEGRWDVPPLRDRIVAALES